MSVSLQRRQVGAGHWNSNWHQKRSARQFSVDMPLSLGQDARPCHYALRSLEPEMKRHSMNRRNAEQAQLLARGMSPRPGAARIERSFSGRMPMA
jgi:hypothetical protein